MGERLSMLREGIFALGLSLGIFVATLFFVAVNSPDSFSVGAPEMWSSIAGALVGGIISAIVAQRSFRLATARELEKQEAERLAIRKAQAYTLLLKLMDTLDRVHKAHNYYRTFEAHAVVEVREKNPATGHLRVKCQIWKPLEGKKKLVDLGLQERSYMLEEGALELFNLVSDLEGALSNCDFLEEKYQAFFEEFSHGQLSGGEVTVQDKSVISEGEPDEFGLLRVTDALDKLRSALTLATPQLFEAIEKVIGLIERKFGEKVEIEFRRTLSGVADYARKE